MFDIYIQVLLFILPNCPFEYFADFEVRGCGSPCCVTFRELQISINKNQNEAKEQVTTNLNASETSERIKVFICKKMKRIIPFEQN